MKVFESYSDLILPGKLNQAISEMGFTSPTPIQKESIPPALEGKDVLGTAQTGTGKTAAFGIPLLSSLHTRPEFGALVLSPTRELSAQIHTVLKQMSRGSNLFGTLVVGGESFGRQKFDLARKVDYIVATPGRMNDHIEQRTVNLSKTKFLVLDEADRMLDMGFLPQIESIIRKLPKDKQTLLFSATMARELMSLVDKMMRNPVRVAIGAVEKTSDHVTQDTIRTTQAEKNTVLLRELGERKGKVLIFCRTKFRADRVMSLIEQKGRAVAVLHGGRTQGQRKRALDNFRTGANSVLVATDLAGRGIDIDDIEHVINYDMPASREDYIHRIGRTGRMGKKGCALSFISDENDARVAMGKSLGGASFGGGQGGQHQRSARPAWQANRGGRPPGGPGASGGRGGQGGGGGWKNKPRPGTGAGPGKKREWVNTNKRALSTLPC